MINLRLQNIVDGYYAKGVNLIAKPNLRKENSPTF